MELKEEMQEIFEVSQERHGPKLQLALTDDGLQLTEEEGDSSDDDDDDLDDDCDRCRRLQRRRRSSDDTLLPYSSLEKCSRRGDKVLLFVTNNAAKIKLKLYSDSRRSSKHIRNCIDQMLQKKAATTKQRALTL